MRVTIQEIAEASGVSRGTVDRVLNCRGRVKADVAERVRQVARDLGYVPKHPREEVVTNRTWRLGVITQLAKSSFMIQINKGIQDIRTQLERRGFEIVLRESDSVDEVAQLRSLEEMEQLGVDGLAIMPVDCDNVRYRLGWLARERSIPVVTFNTDIAGAGRRCFVGMDNRKSGRTAAGLMGMMTGGTGRVLGITGSFSNSAGSHRIDGFVEELRDCYPNIELIGVQSSFDRAPDVEKIILNTMEVYPDLRGIFLASGGQGGVRTALEKLELQKSRPYIIICDLTPRNTALLQDGLADFLIDQDGYQQGYQALSILADHLQWGRGPDRQYYYTEIRIVTKYNV